MLLRKLLLWLNGLAFAATGVLGFFNSNDFASFVGYQLTTGAAHTEFVANYGGLYLFYGLYLCWCGASSERSWQGIAVLCFTSFGLVAGRIAGSIVAVELDPVQFIFVTWELVTGLVTLCILLRSKDY